ncbi:MAG: SPASM domain-containing protein [Planctomycetota bacterium]
MKCIATIAVDMERSPLGMRSRLGDDLAGKPVLRRTVERVLRADRLASVHVLAPAHQVSDVLRLLDDLGVAIERFDEPPPVYAQLVRAGRVWGIDGWRGGIGELCAFDEDIHVPLLDALAQRTGADAVASIPAAAAVLDPALINAMVRHYETYAESARITIVQAPPGLGAVILSSSVLKELAPAGQPPGFLLTYRPDQPAADVTGKEACYRPAAQIIESRGRLLCDTHRSFERVRRLLEAGGEDWDAERIARWLADRQVRHVDPVPEEIEIELTTVDPLTPASLLRPRGDEVGSRGPIRLDVIEAIASAIEPYDDVRVVLGGFGEPSSHPDFARICRIIRDSGAAAIAVRTSAGVDDPAVEAALFGTPVDVVEVTLDAATAQTYRDVHGAGAFDRVLARVESWISLRASRKQVLPLIVPSFVKANENLHEMEEFFDAWQRRLGMALITGYSHCAGQRPPRAVTSTAPPARGACRCVFSRMLILADGRVTTCDQDFAARQTVGRIPEASVPELWQSSGLAAVRADAVADQPLCPACDQWHRT